MSMSDLNPWAAEHRRSLRASPEMSAEERLLYLAAKARGKPLDYTEPPRRPHRRTRPRDAATAPATLLTSDAPITLDSLWIDDLLTCVRAEDCVSQERRDELVRCIEARRRPKRPRTRKPRRPVVRWLSPSPGVHLIGDARIESTLIGLDAAWIAVSNPGERQPAHNWGLPDAAHHGEAVRLALKRAAAFLDAFDARVADAIRRIRVADGYLVYTPGDIDIRTS